MKKRCGFFIRYLWLLGLSALGVFTLLYSPKEAREDLSENRMLAAMPELHGSSLIDSSFMSGFEAWLGDSVAGRSFFMDLSMNTERLLSLKQSQEEELDQVEMLLQDFVAEDMNSASPATHAPSPTASATPLIESSPTAAAEKSAPDTPVSTLAQEPVETACFYMHRDDGSAREVYRFTPETLAKGAAILNDFKAVLPDKGKVVFMAVPMAQLGRSYLQKKEYVSWECQLERELRKVVDEGVEVVNASEALLQAMDRGEYVYFRTDHHWTGYGAYIAYRAAMEQMSIPPVAYEDYELVVLNEMVGSISASQPRSNYLSIADELELPKELYPTQSYLISKLTHREEVPYMRYTVRNYMAFLGGTLGPWRLFEGGAHTGHTALLMGDSFSNAFLPFLLAHYDTVLMMDPRPSYYDHQKAGAAIESYVKEYGIEDIYYVSSFANSLNSTMFQQGYVNRYLHERG